MRRFLSVICIITVLMLGACAPGNIIAPITQPEPEQQDKPAEDVKTDAKPAPAPAAEPVKEKNTSVRPSESIDALGFEGIFESAMRGKSLCLYITDNSAFNAGELSETQWLSALKEEYGVDITYTLRSGGILFPAQAIAARAGSQLDLITAGLANGAGALSLVQNLADTLNIAERTDLPFSKSVFNKTGARLLTGKGNAKVLWYNADIVSDNMPYNLFKMDKWTQDVLASYNETAASKQKKFLECDNWISFASTGAKQITGLSDDGTFLLSVLDEGSIAALKAYADIKTDKTDSRKFKDGNCAFKFTDAPGKQTFELGWVPLPKLDEGGRYVAELCGRAVGLSKTVSEDNKYAALALALLWSARYSQARSDTLLYDYKLSEDAVKDYVDFCEESGGLYSFDAKINSCFESEEIPQALYSDPDTIYNTYYQELDRAQLINNRYL